MSKTDTTTIRVSTEVRDLLNKLVGDGNFGTVDRALMYLLDEDFKRKIVDDWDRHLQNGGFHQELASVQRWDVTLPDSSEEVA